MCVVVCMCECVRVGVCVRVRDVYVVYQPLGVCIRSSIISTFQFTVKAWYICVFCEIFWMVS